MTVEVTTLIQRSPAALRSFVDVQRLGVERHPYSVAPARPSDHSYWRLARRRQRLEGHCIYYQTYDAGFAVFGSVDENDWNINIAPDPAYWWMLDPCILFALSNYDGPPHPIHHKDVKYINGEGGDGCIPVIECELTPDDGLYDKFDSAGLPIEPGTWSGDEAEQQGLGPTGSWVGVYGAFVGDYGHDGGRPEIHPFDAFWRRFHEARSSSISWDLGVFQDDSNRFNDDWSRAPIDVEFRVPFCLDVPVTAAGTVTSQVSFTLDRSAFCSVVGKNTRATGAADLTETFSAPTVLHDRNLRNSLEVSVVDQTGLAGRPFALSFVDLAYTSSQPFNLPGQAWLSGSIAIRAAVEEDGFAYWNFSGPNSNTAAQAPDDGRVIYEPEEVIELLKSRAPRARPVALRVVEARPVVSPGEAPRLAAELVVEQLREDGQAVRRTVAVRPGEVALLFDEASGEAIELDSFDLFAITTTGAIDHAPRRSEADITGVIARLAGLGRDHRLQASTAAIEVDDFVVVDLVARYAPYRDGEVFGEERSLLSESVNRAQPRAIEVRADVQIVGADGSVRRRRVTSDPKDAGDGSQGVRIETLEDGHRLVVGPLGDAPATARVEATLADRFGRRATTGAAAHNFRVADARAWVERAVGISLAQLRERRDGFERTERTAPTQESLATAGMLGALVDVLESLDGPDAVPAARVAGAVRLALRVGELLPAQR